MKPDPIASLANDLSYYKTNYDESILDEDSANVHVPFHGYIVRASGVATPSSSRIQRGSHTQHLVVHLNSEPSEAGYGSYSDNGEILMSSSPDLQDALDDAKAVESEAIEECFPMPSSLAQENSRKLLPLLCAIKPCRFEVYPTQDGEVAIDGKWRAGGSILLLCDWQGGALCLVNNRGNNRRASYSNDDALADGFIREAMRELASGE